MHALRWGWAVVLASVCGQLPPAAWAQATDAVQPVRVGVIGPFSGPSAVFGLPMYNGVRMAVDEINALGGYLGRPIELVVKDDTARPDVGRQRSQELVDERVVAAIGFCNTGVALASLAVYQQANLPLIIPCATGTALTAKYPTPESYVFRTSAQDAVQTRFVVAEIVRRKWTRVAVLADATAYGEAGVADVTGALAERHLKPVYVARFAIGSKDLLAELRAARRAGANVVFSHTVGPENAVIAKGRHQLKWAVPQVGAWPLSFPFFIEGAGDAAEGTLVAQTFIAEPGNERQVAFLSRYALSHGVKPHRVPMVAAQGYDTAYLLLHALFGVRGPLDGSAIKAALETLPRKHHGVVATYDKPFSATEKDALTASMLVMGQVHKGRITFARPAGDK